MVLVSGCCGVGEWLIRVFSDNDFFALGYFLVETLYFNFRIS